MAIVIENQATPANSGSTFDTGLAHGSWGFSPTSGRVLVALLGVTRNNNSPRVPAVPTGWSDGGASGWGSRGQSRIVYKVSDGLETSLSWSLAFGDGLLGSFIWEVSGLDTNNLLNQAKARIAGSAATFTVTADATNAASPTLAVLVGTVYGRQISAFDSLTAGWDSGQLQDNGAVSPWTLMSCSRIAAADETPSVTATWTGSGIQNQILVVFNGAAEAGGGGSDRSLLTNIPLSYLYRTAA